MTTSGAAHEPWAYKLSIIENLSRFHQAIDERAWNDLHAILDSSFIWDWEATSGDATSSDVVQGREAFTHWLEVALGDAAPRHLTTSHVVAIQGQTATSRSYMIVFDRYSLELQAIGTVEANHRYQNDEWIITHVKLVERLQEGLIGDVANALAGIE